MVVPIHTAPKEVQDMVKREVNQSMSTQDGIVLRDIPGVNGIGIGFGKVVVSTDTDLQSTVLEMIPTEVMGVPVEVQALGRIESIPATDDIGFGPSGFNQQQMGMSPTGAVQGGIKIQGPMEFGSCFGVLHDSMGQNWAVCSSHVFTQNRGMTGAMVKVNNMVVGTVMKDGRHCGGMSKLDAAGALLNKGVKTSDEVLGIGTPVGFAAATVGMNITTNGIHSGKTTQKVTMINMSIMNDTGGNCMTNFQDGWVGSVRSQAGDSGSAMLSDDKNLIGILTTNIGQGSYNLSAKYMPMELGLTTGMGVSMAPATQMSLPPDMRMGAMQQGTMNRMPKMRIMRMGPMQGMM